MAHPKAIQQLGLVRKGDRCLAAPPNVAGEIDGVIGMVTQLSEGIAPKEKDIRAFSDLFRLVLKRCEDFHIVEVFEASPGKLNFAKKLLRGSEAVKHTFLEVQTMMNEGGVAVNLQTLRPLKTFSWVLTAAEQDLLRTWISRVLCVRQGNGPLAIAGGDVPSPKTTLVSAPSFTTPSTSSSSSSGMLDVLHLRDTPTTASKQNKNKEGEEIVDNKAHVMQFFYTKKKG